MLDWLRLRARFRLARSLRQGKIDFREIGQVVEAANLFLACFCSRELRQANRVLALGPLVALALSLLLALRLRLSLPVLLP